MCKVTDTDIQSLQLLIFNHNSANHCKISSNICNVTAITKIQSQFSQPQLHSLKLDKSKSTARFLSKIQQNAFSYHHCTQINTLHLTSKLKSQQITQTYIPTTSVQVKLSVSLAYYYLPS